MAPSLTNTAPPNEQSNQIVQQNSNEEKSIRLVVQRFRKASLLLDETHTVTVGGSSYRDESFSGILVYASFAKSATREKVFHAARIIMNLPVLTRGHWGDGSDPVSVLDLATSGGGVAVMLVPQANLISKVSASYGVEYNVLTCYTHNDLVGKESGTVDSVSWAD
jgi:hypothetical protein